MNPESQRLGAFAGAVRESTLKRLRLVPPGRENWRLTPGSMSFGDLVFHLIEADEWLFRKLAEPSLSPMVGRAHTTSISAPEQFVILCRRLEETGRQRNNVVASLSADRLETTVPDSRFPGPVTLWWVIVRGNLEHEVHHRGQVIAWLRAVGVGSKSASAASA